MGERFGFYTMMAILVLFLQARYGLSEADAGDYYSWFYFAIYALALIGGFLADWTKKYKLVIMAGQIIMFAGYCIVAIPNIPLWSTLMGLFVIALGNGLFKGNLQAVVGQLYDDEKYSKLRDSAFLVFYMGINVGAFFAPFAAAAIRNWWLKANGFLHDGSLPALCHQYLGGKITDTTQLAELANKVDLNGKYTNDLAGFASTYLDVFSRGYNWAFAIAAGGLIISLLIYLFFYKSLPNKEKIVTVKKTNISESIYPVGVALGLVGLTAVIFHYAMNDYKLGLAIGLFVGFVAWIFLSSTKEEKPRISALVLVYIVVVFFWMSFHQNGLALTFFARDYTVKEVAPFTFLFFNLKSLLCLILTIAGLVLLFNKDNKRTYKIAGLLLTLVFGTLVYLLLTNYNPSNPITPEVFQSFNPLFIVALTPLVMGLFAYLNRKKIEPSTPKKIGFGMIIAALGFLIVLVVSIDLVSPHLLGKGIDTPDSSRVSPYWLMSSYLVLTIAELFLSPMGLSFVSKVAPSRFQGLMQGGWLLATAIGNKLLFVGSLMWRRVDLYLLWGIFFVCCILSAIFIFSIMKRLENATK
ncbi:MAG TPA: MFS transporter, partial [Bacteroidales bacterium]|nr:MFS transporter [Bacteroidales bacterium]